MVYLLTGVVVPCEMIKDLVDVGELGWKHMNIFIEERLITKDKNFWDPVPQPRLKTFASLKRKKKKKKVQKDEKSLVITADRNLFGRLVIVSELKDIDLRGIMTYELSAVPHSLAHSDGTLRQTTKSVLLAIVETGIDPLRRLLVTEPAPGTALVVDAIAVLQSIKPLRSETLRSLADSSWDILTKHLNQQGCTRIDIVFDQYDKKDSIKDQARLRRGSLAALEINISGGNTPVPNQWSKFMSNCKNKATLIHFLCERWYDICPQILPAGKSIVLGGGFCDPLKCVKLSYGHFEECTSNVLRP